MRKSNIIHLIVAGIGTVIIIFSAIIAHASPDTSDATFVGGGLSKQHPGDAPLFPQKSNRGERSPDNPLHAGARVRLAQSELYYSIRGPKRAVWYLSRSCFRRRIQSKYDR